MITSALTRITAALLFATALAAAPFVSAQEALSVTVTPPLFQLTIGPGETWSSAVKVVNSNNYDVTYVAQVVDFEQNGETGQSKFVPLIESFANEPVPTNSLGSWIDYSKEPFTVPAGKTGEVAFTVRVPLNADPGGHYAAIMVGPYQESRKADGPSMRISSFVTSLLFVRIKGEVIESGRIREFTSEKQLYQNPLANFSLRFENTGNTHLRPTGSITIFNMWGKKRGEVLINEKSGFGNVLPRSIRKFEFTWDGEANVFEMGRYSAVVTLGYGDDEKQNTTATTYFWIVPLVPVAGVLAVVVFLLSSIMLLVRRYINRALELERERRGISAEAAAPISTFRALVQPLREGVVDLRSASGRAPSAPEAVVYQAEPLTMGGFASKYRLFFTFIALIAVLVSLAVLFFGAVLEPERTYEIRDMRQSATSTVTR